ncbi:MAG: hypothetical protein Q8M29_04625 [Bacteroidota bacterium]|nr:hypothetical protein [Bacteroidota bacterium]
MEKTAKQITVALPADTAMEMFVIGATFSAATENYHRVTEYKTPEYFSSSGMKYFELNDKITGFENLKANWDSYNADPISSSAITIALEILDFLKREGTLTSGIEVNVFPMRDGGIQFEFEAENLSAELEINPNGDLTFILFNNHGDIILKQPIKIYELSELSSYLEETVYA